MVEQEILKEQHSEAFQAGRRAGFGVAALTLGLVSFLSMLGAEKAVLAIVLGVLAVRGSAPGALARGLGIAAVAIGVVFLLTLALLLLVYWEQVVELVRLLQKLS